MQKADQPEFLKVLNGMATMKRSPLTPEAIDLWWECMRGWTLGDFKLVAAELLASNKWMPEVYDFNEFKRKGDMTAGEAFTLVLEHVRTSRYEKHPSIGDSRIDNVVRMMGGWKAIAFSNPEHVHFLEKRFAEHFASQRDVSAARVALCNLTDAPALSALRSPIKLLKG